MKKKIIIGIVVIVCIVLSFLAFRAYVGHWLLINTKERDRFKEYSRYDELDGGDDNNLPDYQKKFYPYDYIKENKEKFYELNSVLPKDYKELYNSENNREWVLISKILLSEYVESFKDIVPIIKNKMKEKKRNIPPTFKESESLPFSPNFGTVRQTARYWYAMTMLLSHKKDYETSLYLCLAMLYLSKDLQTNYKNSGSPISSSYANLMNNLACEAIFLWASKPKPQYKEVSKEIAKDVLDFVKTDYPISKIIEYDYYMFDDLRKFFESKVSSLYANLPTSIEYKTSLNILFKEPMKFYDKPLCDIENEIKSYNDRVEKLLKTKFNDKCLAYYVYFNPDMFMCARLLYIAYSNYESLKKSKEKSLAKMEMAAIALAINSYVCENNRYPESMEELSKWFGSELPKNRLTNTPYELDFKGNHVLYNKFNNKSSSKEDEFYFDFSMN